MNLRLFIGSPETLPYLRKWLFERHPEAMTGETPIRGGKIHRFLTWGEIEDDSLLRLKALPTYNQIVVNIFLEPKVFFSFSELSSKIPRVFNYSKQYYHLSLKDSFKISWHENGSDIYLGTAEEPRAVHLHFNKNNLKLQKKSYDLQAFSYHVSIVRPFKRSCIEQMLLTLKQESLNIIISRLLPGKEKLQQKVFTQLESTKNIEALSYLLINAYFSEPLDENLLNNFLKNPKLLCFQHLEGERKNLAFALGKEKLISLLSKAKDTFSYFILISDTFSLASFLPLETVKRVLNQERVRKFDDAYDLLGDENYYENVLKTNEYLASSFSQIQNQVAKLNNQNFIIPLSLQELKTQAEIFKNCSLIYAQDVVNKQLGFMAYYYENHQPVACLYFDQFRNIIEIAGVRNRELSLEERNKITNLLQAN